MAETPTNQDKTEIEEQNSPQEEDDSKPVKLYALGIGEADPKTNLLVALEMKDSQKIGFKKRGRTPLRKKSIDGIFGKINKIEVEDNLDKTPLKNVPRRSLMAMDPSLLGDGPDESD